MFFVVIIIRLNSVQLSSTKDNAWGELSSHKFVFEIALSKFGDSSISSDNLSSAIDRVSHVFRGFREVAALSNFYGCSVASIMGASVLKFRKNIFWSILE